MKAANTVYSHSVSCDPLIHTSYLSKDRINILPEGVVILDGLIDLPHLLYYTEKKV